MQQNRQQPVLCDLRRKLSPAANQVAGQRKKQNQQQWSKQGGGLGSLVVNYQESRLEPNFWGLTCGQGSAQLVVKGVHIPLKRGKLSPASNQVVGQR